LDAKTVRILLKAIDEMSGPLKAAAAAMASAEKAMTGSVNRINQSATSTGPSFIKMSSAMAAGTLAAGAVMKGISLAGDAILGTAKASATYETSMNTFQAVSQASDEQMQAVRATAVALGKDLSLPATSSADAGKAMTELAKAGLSVNDVLAASKGVLQLSAAAHIDEANAAKITAQSLNAFGLAGTEASHIADMLSTASNISAAEIVDLGAGLQQAGFAFKATGRPIQELVGSLALLTNAGLTGSDAGTALKNAIVRIVDPTKDAQKTMKAYGIELFDSAGKMKSIPDIVDVLNKSLGGLSDEQKNAALSNIFLSDGWKAFQPLLDQGGDKLRATIAQLDRQGAASDLAAAKTKGLAGAWDGLQSQLETASQTLGSKLSPSLEALVRSASSLAGEVADALEGVDFSGFTTKMGTLGQNASAAFYDAGQAAAAFGDIALAKIPGPAGEIERILAHVGGDVLIGFAAILRGDAKGALDAFGQANTDAASAVDTFKASVGLASIELPTFGQVVGETQALMGDFTDAAVTSGAIMADWSKGMGLSALALKQIFTGDWAGAVTSMNTAAAAFGKIPDDLAANLERSKERWAAATIGMSGDLQTLLDTSSQILPQIGSGLEDELEVGFDAAAQAVKRSNESMLADLRTGADAIDRDFGQALTETFGGLPEEVQTTTNQLAPLVDTAGAAMTTSMQTSMADLLATVASDGSGIVTATGQVGTDASAEFGANVASLPDAAAEAGANAVAAMDAEAGPAGAAGAGVGSAMVSGLEGPLTRARGRLLSQRPVWSLTPSCEPVRRLRRRLRRRPHIGWAWTCGLA
jgi:TP901 family phage tail tape measure protein